MANTGPNGNLGHGQAGDLTRQLHNLPGFSDALAGRLNVGQFPTGPDGLVAPNFREANARYFARQHGIDIGSGAHIDNGGTVHAVNDQPWYADPRWLGPIAVGAASLGAGAFAGGGSSATTIGEAANGLGPQAAGAAYPGAGLFGAPAAAASSAAPVTAAAASAPAVIAPAAAHTGAGLMGVSGNTLFNGGTQLFGNLYGAWMQGKAADKAATAESAAARYAADVQAKAQAEALAFSKQQAENAFQNSEVSRRGNYDMYAAGQRRLGFLGQEVGLGPREIPGYVPGVDPHYSGGTIGAAAGGGAPPPDMTGVKAKFDALFPGESLTPDMLAAHKAELEAMGFTLNPNAHGQITDLSFGNSGYSLDPIYGAGAGINKKQWIVNGPGGGGSGAQAAPSRPAYVSPSVPFLNSNTVAPALGYLGSY